MERLATLTAVALFCAVPATAQDLVGFDLDSFGRTVLSRKQFGGDMIPEVAAGAYNNEFISTYSAKSIFASIGRSVGRLDVATDNGVFPCTAFLVADDLIMTNNHCVPGILDDDRAKASTIVGVRFVMGYTQEGVTEGTTSFLVDPAPVETSKPLDYTVLRILGDSPGREFGTLQLASATPVDNDPYWIIGHPMGEAQRISREKCRANAPALSDGQLLHTCDTLPGNSGSPVIDATTRQVIGLHHAGSARNSINYAIPMAQILANSTVLTAAAGPAPAPESPESRAFSRLSDALDLADDDARRAALESLVTESPDTAAARTASRLIAAMQPPPPPAPSLADRMAADADVQACDRLAGDRFHPDRDSGLMLAKGIVFEAIDPEPAIAACLSALETFPDHPRMAAFLGEALSAAERLDDSFAAYRTAALAGDAIGQAGLGISYLWGLGTDPDPAQARDWLEKSAAQGHPIAKTALGVIYQYGQGVTADPDRALKFYQQGADAGYHGAQDQLGDLYLAGDIVPQSDKTAAEWFEKSAAQGNASAQFNLGQLYMLGNGVEKSDARAVRLYRDAAEQDFSDAQLALGNMYLWGRGVTQSETEAARWYKTAMDNNNAGAMFALGWLTEQGRGVAADPAEAARLYIASLKAGSDWSLNRESTDWVPDTARALQQALAAEGVYSGATDGRIGKLTQDAMRRLLPQ
ncbi:bifunctional trypsin-like peptidase domain-containing/SEL1-like repeat protein [Antarctobacter sp.]|uniref:bifunctional trypsin-like peptidase domain-containing/SEL1-like repeat protein n=1 Tax=Antarctobacter sp. TaxID=1872577 RepID=UPI002B273C77|nr:bifunctional trypsin-like peptidase domain-containing/SEL1-like repeat protein [Antarctobacter sp.]